MLVSGLKVITVRTVINEIEYCGQESENSLEAAEIFNTFCIGNRSVRETIRD